MIRRRVFSLLSPRAFHELVSGRRRGGFAALARGLLRLAEVPYAAVVQYRNRRYDRGKSPAHRVGVPVVSVGNITAGGTGKTPLVAWLAGWFGRHGVRVALVSRGYRADGERPNDEARELAQRLPDVPHFQNPDRVAAARMAIDQTDCQLIVLDDAFQHRRIDRDLDIVLIDALQPFGFGHLLPRGLLREPLSQLARADVIGLSRAEAITPGERRALRARVERFAPHALWVELAHRPARLINVTGETAAVETLAAHRVAVFAGIGNPEGFYHTLEQLKYQVVARRQFPDHHDFGADDVASLRRWLDDQNDVAAVVSVVDRDRVPLAAGTRFADQ